MKWWWGIAFILVFAAGAGGVWHFFNQKPSVDVFSPRTSEIAVKPLEKYSIENLSKREYDSKIFLDDVVATESAYTVRKFHYDSDGKKVTGLAHLPGACPCPVIVQLRGYVPRETFTSGVGTRRSAEVFARNGFISLAPDFLGYGGSDNPSADIFEARFETYTTAINLISAVKGWEHFDGNLHLWGHSNGGQVALTVLEVLQKPIPTVLWAPVTKPFPYSILYFTDEAEDSGKEMRRKLAEFENDYDVFNYDLTRHMDKITAPLQIHQGLADEAVPYRWSKEFVERLQKLDKRVEYHEYLGADHNLSGVWNAVVERSILWYNKNRVNEDIE